MMKYNTLKIGTRGSLLALWQAREAQRALFAAFPEIESEIVVIKTKGDIILDVSLSKIGDKGLFTKEIEQSLLNGEIDVAVHSLKDLPTDLPEGLIVGGVLPRGEVRDVFLSKEGLKLSELSNSHRVATSSLRRQAQLLHHFPELNIVDIRGNVNSRIKKMNEGHCEGLVMAGAGIIRLGLDHLITQYIEPSVLMPAVSQGVIGFEMREEDDETRRYLDGITDSRSWNCAMAERAFLRTMEGGCQVPVACYTEAVGEKMRISGMIASLNGKTLIRKSIECVPDELSEKAIELAFSILEDGGKEILETIRIV